MGFNIFGYNLQMKHILLITLLLCVGTSNATSQIPIGKWRDHYSYKQLNHLAIGTEKVFGSSENGVFWFSPTDGLTQKLTTAQGLSDIGISTIEYSEQQAVLAIGYENGNIDLVINGRIENIPFIKQKQLQGSKKINHFFFDGNNQILVSTGFGIVVINISKLEISETYYLGEGGTDCWVYGTTIFNNRIYAATDKGLLSAISNDPLLIHYSNWIVEQDLPHDNAQFSSIGVFGNKLIVNQLKGGFVNDVIWYNDGNNWNVLNDQFLRIKNIRSSNGNLVIVNNEGILIYTDIPGLANSITEYGNGLSFNPNSAGIDSQGNIVVADGFQGMMYRRNNSWTRVRPNGPDDDKTYYVLPTSTDLYVLAGARSDVWGNRFFPLTFHKLSNNQWHTTANFDYFDAVRITPSPSADDEFYISTWGHGVVVYKNGQPVQRYSPENSSLQTIIPGAFCRIGGVAFDSKGNMWVSNAGVPNPISIMTPERNWTGFPYENLISSQRLSDITISPSGHLWVIIPSGGGLFALDPGENPTSISSHRARTVKPIDGDGASLPNDIISIAFDKDGYLWVGTNEGVLISYNPHKVFEPAEFSIQRVKVPDEVDGFAVHLLESQTVTSIAVDGGNRKWFGTQRSGAYLQSADGSKQLLHFTQENSPLPSNTIQHIGIHPKTGEVFFATDKGLVSYRGEAIEPLSKFGKVYAFPNPVRPDFTGPITITGLVDKTNVKITDISGNLVFETTSIGGQAIWNGTNIFGQRVSTGVYLYFCSDNLGEQTAVGKILFIK
jgi:hypothetical protein